MAPSSEKTTKKTTFTARKGNKIQETLYQEASDEVEEYNEIDEFNGNVLSWSGTQEEEGRADEGEEDDEVFFDCQEATEIEIAEIEIEDPFFDCQETVEIPTESKQADENWAEKILSSPFLHHTVE